MKFFKNMRLILPVLTLAFLFYSCSDNSSKISKENNQAWEKIVKNGKIKILTRKNNADKISDKISNKDIEHSLLKSFTDEKNIQPEYIFVDALENLFTALDSGKGDIVAANISITNERLQKYDFSIPIFSTKDVIVTNIKNRASSLNDLKAAKIYYEQNSSYFKIAQKLIHKVPALRLVPAPYIDSTHDILQKVILGKYDFAIADKKLILTKPQLKIIYEFPDNDNIAWVFRKNSHIKTIINDFLKRKLKTVNKQNFIGDMKQIKKRGFIRVLTRNNPVCYFIHRGAPMGFEYEFISLFAKANNLQVVAIVPPEWKNLTEWLENGKGDIIAAGMSLTEKRKKLNNITFSTPYNQVNPMLVCRKKDAINLQSTQDLNGRTIVVRKNSSYREILENLQEKGIKLKIKSIPETMETYEIISAVEQGIYDLTIADDLFVKTSPVKNKIATPFSIGKTSSYVWAVRKNNSQLLNAVNSFIKKEYKNISYNVLLKRYFKSHSTQQKFNTSVAYLKKSKISDFDHIIKKYSKIYDLPWCLIAAQIFQESRFNPHAKSWSGAKGLLQLMDQTANEMNCLNIYDPEQNIQAGVKYLKYLYERQPDKITKKNRICFALASYNGGFGHLQDARKLAKQLNFNNNIWFDNVENAMKLLSYKKYYKQTKYGYCRSNEITSYVRNILIRFVEYSQTFSK